MVMLPSFSDLGKVRYTSTTMTEITPPSQPTTGAPLPPWRRTPQQPVSAFHPASPQDTSSVRPEPAAPASVPPTPSAAKDWGPLKPIRTVPKPSEAKVAYVLAQTTPVMGEDHETSRKRWIIAASVIGIVVIAGGTLAFVFFGGKTSTNLHTQTNEPVFVVNTNRTKNGNVNTSGVFPNANQNVNTNASVVNMNVNGNVNVNLSTSNAAITNTAADSDNDGLTDAQEKVYGTDINTPDTDSDGYSDGQEVQSGYNPLGSGKL